MTILHCKTFIHVGHIRIRKDHCRIVLIFGCAFFVSADAATAWAGPAFFPHVYHHYEFWVANFGKLGAAMGTFVPLFESFVSAVAREVA
jgi:hypothetical protein